MHQPLCLYLLRKRLPDISAVLSLEQVLNVDTASTLVTVLEELLLIALKYIYWLNEYDVEGLHDNVVPRIDSAPCVDGHSILILGRIVLVLKCTVYEDALEQVDGSISSSVVVIADLRPCGAFESEGDILVSVLMPVL